jgi:type IV secretion system protein VirB10
VAYGQDGVQVVWERIIYPDGSSVDLNGMVGLDSHGNAETAPPLVVDYEEAGRMIGTSYEASGSSFARASSRRSAGGGGTVALRSKN